ncbi:hypothetical protein HK096_009806, partial [Nowakowskiella sp. JEL0078]
MGYIVSVQIQNFQGRVVGKRVDKRVDAFVANVAVGKLEELQDTVGRHAQGDVFDEVFGELGEGDAVEARGLERAEEGDVLVYRRVPRVGDFAAAIPVARALFVEEQAVLEHRQLVVEVAAGQAELGQLQVEEEEQVEGEVSGQHRGKERQVGGGVRRFARGCSGRPPVFGRKQLVGHLHSAKQIIRHSSASCGALL